MANEQNLRPFTSDQSREEAKKNGQKGGIASGESKRRAKHMKELAEKIGGLVPSQKIKDKIKEIFPGLEDDEIVNDTFLLSKVFEQAAKGNIKAFETFRDTAGQKPINVNEHTGKDGKDLIPSVIRDDISGIIEKSEPA